MWFGWGIGNPPKTRARLECNCWKRETSGESNSRPTIGRKAPQRVWADIDWKLRSPLRPHPLSAQELLTTLRPEKRNRRLPPQHQNRRPPAHEKKKRQTLPGLKKRAGINPRRIHCHQHKRGHQHKRAIPQNNKQPPLRRGWPKFPTRPDRACRKLCRTRPTALKKKWSSRWNNISAHWKNACNYSGLRTISSRAGSKSCSEARRR